MTWHINERTWAAYARGSLPDVAEASLETHIAECTHCQHAARPFGPDPGDL